MPFKLPTHRCVRMHACVVDVGLCPLHTQITRNTQPSSAFHSLLLSCVYCCTTTATATTITTNRSSRSRQGAASARDRRWGRATRVPRTNRMRPAPIHPSHLPQSVCLWLVLARIAAVCLLVCLLDICISHLHLRAFQSGWVVLTTYVPGSTMDVGVGVHICMGWLGLTWGGRFLASLRCVLMCVCVRVGLRRAGRQG